MKRGRPPYEDVLTPREWEVLELVERGMTNEEIADQLGVSHATAKFHVSEILSKLNLPNRREAGAWRVRRMPAALTLLKGGAFLAATAAVAAVIYFGLVPLMLQDSRSGATQMGKVAYVVDGDVWVKQLPNGPEEQLTNWGDVRGEPRWSASGEWLSVTRIIPRVQPTPPPGLLPGPTQSDQSNWVIDANGKRERQVEGGGNQFLLWSPVKDEYLFNAENPDGIRMAMIEEADGSNRRILNTAADRAFEGGPATWAPSGEWIIRQLRVSLSLTAEEFEDLRARGEPLPIEMSLSRIRTDGTGEHEFYRMTHPGGDGAAMVHQGVVTDSQLLTTCAANCDEHLPLSNQVQALPLDGEVVHGPYVTLQDPYSEPREAQSPASNRIAAVMLPERPDQAGSDISVLVISLAQMALYDVGAGSAEYVTEPGEAPAHPSWSPDGRTLFFAAADGSLESASTAVDLVAGRRIWSVDADGSNRKQLTDDPRYRDEYPHMTADGTSVVFTRIDLESEEDTASVWLLELATGKLTMVVDDFELSQFSSDLGTVWPRMIDLWQPK